MTPMIGIDDQLLKPYIGGQAAIRNIEKQTTTQGEIRTLSYEPKNKILSIGFKWAVSGKITESSSSWVPSSPEVREYNTVSSVAIPIVAGAMLIDPAFMGEFVVLYPAGHPMCIKPH